MAEANRAQPAMHLRTRRFGACVAVMLAMLFSPFSLAGEKLKLAIIEPYLDIHTGPGKNYPVFYVAQRGETIEVQKRRNEWFKVTLKVDSERIKVGWVHRKAIGLTLVANHPISDNNNGEPPQLAKDDPLLAGIFNPKYYFGFSYGRTSSADLVGIYAGRNFTDSISVELQASEFLGRNTQGATYGGAILFAPYPKWRLSPFASIGGGRISSEARGTNSQQNNSSDQFLLSGMGLNLLLSERYRLRFEYRHLNVLTSTDQNEELETWHIGFTGYF